MTRCIPNNLKAIRKEKGYSQTELAQTCKIPQEFISSLEKGTESPIYLRGGNGIKPYIKPLIQELETSLENVFPQISRWIEPLEPYSIIQKKNQSLYDNSQIPFDSLKQTISSEEIIEYREVFDLFLQTIPKLYKSRKSVLEKRIFNGLTFKEIGKLNNYTDTRAKQLYDEAIKKLKKLMLNKEPELENFFKK